MATITGVLVNDGKDIALERILNNVNTDRLSLNLGLMTNAAGLSATSTLANITAPSATNGYAVKALTDGSWTLSSNGAGLGYTGTYAQQTFTASGGAFSAAVTGWYIYTTGTTPKLICYCYSGSSDSITDGMSVDVTPSVLLEDGTDGQLVDEGIQDMLHLFLNDADLNSNRGTNLYMDLYTNASGLSGASTYTTMTEPTGGGYDRKVLTDASWAISGGVATPGDTTSWTATAAAYTGAVVGYYIASNGTTRRLYCYDEYISQPITVADGDTYTVDLTVST